MSTATTAASAPAAAAATDGKSAATTAAAATAAPAKSVIHTTAELKSSDAQLKADAAWAAAAPKYEPFVADDAAVAKVVKALEDKKYAVTVVDSPAAALTAITSDTALPKGSSVAFAASITLEQIGLIEHVKARTDLKNYRAESLAAMAKGDMPTAFALRFEGAQKADLFFTSIAAVTESGDMLNADASGSRVAPMVSGAKKVVIVVGANKIVKDVAAGITRLEEYVIPIEGAHMRAAYNRPGTALLNLVITRGAFNPARFHVVVVKGHSLGY